MREEEIINQMMTLLDSLDLNELGVKHAFADDVARYNKFRKIALGKNAEKEAEVFDMKAYAIYLLTEGSMTEKRSLLANLESRLTLTNKTLAISVILDSAPASLE